MLLAVVVLVLQVAIHMVYACQRFTERAGVSFITCHQQIFSSVAPYTSRVVPTKIHTSSIFRYQAGNKVDLSKELDPAAVAGLLKLEIRHHGFPLDEATARVLAPAAVADAKGGVDRDAVTTALQAMDPSRAAGLRKLAVLLVSELEWS